jgi:hypothetical protein
MIEAGAKVAKCRPNQRRARFAASRLLEIQYPHDGIWKDCPWCVHARARQTLEVVLPDRLHLGRRRPNAAEFRTDAEAGGSVWQRSELTDVTAKVVIYEAFVEGKLEAPKHLARTVHDLYFDPKYEEFRSRTIWSLSNAFTSAFKELEPIPQFRATAKLGKFLEARFSQAF